jgi:hypothetical protein
MAYLLLTNFFKIIGLFVDFLSSELNHCINAVVPSSNELQCNISLVLL